MILHIVSSDLPRCVNFAFYEAQYPFLKKPTEHIVPTVYENTRAMLVNDLRSAEDKKDSFNNLLAIVEDKKRK